MLTATVAPSARRAALGEATPASRTSDAGTTETRLQPPEIGEPHDDVVEQARAATIVAAADARHAHGQHRHAHLPAARRRRSQRGPAYERGAQERREDNDGERDGPAAAPRVRREAAASRTP